MKGLELWALTCVGLLVVASIATNREPLAQALTQIATFMLVLALYLRIVRGAK